MRILRFIGLTLWVPVATIAVACNAITGVGNLTFDRTDSGSERSAPADALDAPAEPPVTVLATGQNFGGGELDASGATPAPHIAVDSTNVYWTTVDGTVAECPISGCGQQPVILATAQDQPTYLAVDSTNVYWITSSNLSACAIAGCGDKPTVVTSGSDALGLIVDNGRFYLSFQTSTNSGIFSCSLSTGCSSADGGANNFLVLGVDVGPLTASGGTIYWVGLSGVYDCSESGCNMKPATLSSQGNDETDGYSIATDTVSVYWLSAYSDELLKCGLGGCASPTPLAELEPSGGHIIGGVVGTQIYFLDGAGAIRSAVTDVSGTSDVGAGTVVYSGPHAAFALAVDNTNLYWLATDGTVVLTKRP
jgi:hypothetical protein